jgi:hypothetical protein
MRFKLLIPQDSEMVPINLSPISLSEQVAHQVSIPFELEIEVDQKVILAKLINISVFLRVENLILVLALTSTALILTFIIEKIIRTDLQESLTKDPIKNLTVT